MVVLCVMAAGGDDANGDCGAGGNEFGGAGGEGGGGAGDTSLLYTSPRVDRDLGDVQQGEHRLHQPWHHLLHHHS